MSKRTHFTTVTALPAGISRETVLTTLHAHTEMIDLNPLVIERHPIRPPPSSSAEEAHCQWYSISDKISYLPGVNGSLTFMGCFHDLPDGLQTHILAPMGLDMKGRWTLGGSLPGEPRQPQELGLGMPKQGLWLKEDVEMKCNFAMTRFVRKTTEKAHATLVDRLVEKAHIKEGDAYNERLEGASFVSQGSRRLSGGPPGYEHHQSMDVGGLVNAMPTGGTMGSRGSPRLSSYSHGHGSDAGSLRSGAGSQHGTHSPPTTGAYPPPGVHPAYTHQQLYQQAQTPTSYPPDNKHPYEPATAFQQPSQAGQYPPDTKYGHMGPYTHQQGLPLHPSERPQPHDVLQQQHLQNPSPYSPGQDPSMYPQPLKPQRQSTSQPIESYGRPMVNANLHPMQFAAELPGGEARTPTELDGGPQTGH